MNKLLFLQKNLFILQRINEEKSNEKQEQSKRRLSTSDDDLILVIKNKDNLISSTTTNDDYDYSSDDIENIIDNSAEQGRILFDL